jgi:hypothetical protein
MKSSRYHSLSNIVRLLLLATLIFTLILGTGQTARAAASPAPVDLGTAAHFAILTKTGITNVPASAITGDLGVSPIDSTAITGFSLIADSTNTFSTSSQVTGKIYAANYAAPTPVNMTTSVSNMETAYTDAAGRSLPDFTELYSGNLSGKTLVPGLYKWGTGVLITTDVTLAGPADAVWIFQIAGDLTIGSSAKVLLSGGAEAQNIFWQVGGGTGVEIGTTAHVEGNILAAKAIHLRTGSSLNGRALAQTAVTLDHNVVVIPYPYSNILLPTSFVEMMGLPGSQSDTSYWFPWYKNAGEVDTQLRLGNVSGSAATVHVYIGGVEMTGSPFNLTVAGAGQSARVSFAGVNDGPMQVVSDVNIVASERLLYYATNGRPTSFSEMLGLPNSQLSNTYWLPWYKNVGEIDTQLRLGNVSGSVATVHVYIAGAEMTGSPFSLTASGVGQSARLSFAGVNDGPVQVVSDVNIVVSQRLLYSANDTPTSFVEMLGLPVSQLNTTYWFPWYRNDGIVDTQLRIGNVSGAVASVHVYIAGVEVAGSPFTLTASGAGQSTRLSFTGGENGPVKVVSDQNIVITERLIYFANGLPTSFSEMLGLPNSQLNTTFWLPWYKNAGEIDTQLRIGNVSGSTATVHVYVGGAEMTGSPFTLTASGAGQSLRVNFPVNDGPVQVVSDQNIVVSQRILYYAR